MARARNRNNQRGDYGRKPVGPIGKKPTPRTGGGMKKPPIRGPKPTDTGGRVVTPKKRPPIRGPKPTDTGGRVMPKKYKPRLQVDPLKPKKYKPRLQVDPRKPKKPVQRPRRAPMGNRSRRGFRR